MTGPASAGDLAALNQLGEALSRLGFQRVSLAYDGLGEAYYADGIDRGGEFFTGYGSTAQEALETAMRWRDGARQRRAQAVAHA